MSKGRLRTMVQSVAGIRPIENARVSISETGDAQNVIEEIITDSSGIAESVTLTTPPLDYSMQPGQPQPYALYSIRVTAEGYAPVFVSGIQVMAGELSIQEVLMKPLEVTDETTNIVIPGNTLFEDYPPKIPESDVKTVQETGEIVLSRVVIPEYVIVHDGVPSDSRAKNYYVTFRDYIGNVASGEIYATWPEATIRANILAIMSFTLNRVYTEWYRNKGYDFTITSSTAYDQTWSYGRNIFESISRIVDEVFANYISKPNVKQPILTQYCDGRTVTCPGWLSQWGSKYLGDINYSTIEILRNYYGSDIYINTAEEIAGIPASWPRMNLEVGARGEKVRQMQEQLLRISQSYPAIPKIVPDGVYGQQTSEAVRIFQRVFNLPATGIVDYATWYKISQIYVGVTGIGELYP